MEDKGKESEVLAIHIDEVWQNHVELSIRLRGEKSWIHIEGIVAGRGVDIVINDGIDISDNFYKTRYVKRDKVNV